VEKVTELCYANWAGTVSEWSNVLYPAKAGRVAKEVRYFIIRNMPFVYILQDTLSKKYYTGSCVHLLSRVKRHKQHTGGKTTKKGNWELLCYQQVETLAQARTLEKKIKSYKGGNEFKKIVTGTVSEWSNVPLC
jgi:predicted GIY-YIG superfamily endonuclease